MKALDFMGKPATRVETSPADAWPNPWIKGDPFKIQRQLVRLAHEIHPYRACAIFYC
jgi:hypothetical protein